MSERRLELALNVTASLNKARAQLNELEQDLRKTASAGTSAGTGARAAGESVDAMGRSAKTAESRLGALGRAAKKTGSSFRGLKVALAGAFVVHEASALTRALVEVNTEAQRIHYTFQQAFGDDAQNQLKFVRDLSQQLGLSFKDTAESFGQIGASAQGTGVQARDLQTLFRGLSEAATVLHTPASELNATFIQLAQGISLGKLQMQDIRAIAQHLPGTMSILQAAAKRLGTTLEDALAHGGLDARKAIAAIGEVAHERFGIQAVAASHSLNAELNRLHSTLFTLKTDGTGFGESFASAVRTITQQLNDPGIRAGLKSLISGLGTAVSEAAKLAGYAANIAKFIGENAARSQGHFAIGDTAAIDKRIGEIQTELKARQSFGGRLLRSADAYISAASPGAVLLNAGLTGSADLSNRSTEYLQQQLSYLKKLYAVSQKNDRAALAPKRGSGSSENIPTVYVTAQRSGADASPPSKAAQRQAAARAKAAAAANQQLRETFISLQAAQDPVAAAYARYNQVVDKATAAADKAKQATGANTAAIDGQLAAIKHLAAGTRDAAVAQAQQADAAKRLQAVQEQVQSIESDASRQSQQIQAEQQAGLISEYSARKQLLAIRQREADQLHQLLPALRAAAQATGDPKAIEGVKNLEAEIARLKIRANDLRTAFESGLTSGLEQGLEDLATGATTAAGAFRELAQAVLRSLTQVAARALAAKAIGALSGLLGGGKQTADVGQGAAKLTVASAALAAGGGLLGVNAQKLQQAADTLLIANAVGSVGAFASGGYTGAGGVNDVAGVVHAGEYVQPQYRMREPGALAFMRAFHRQGMAALQADPPGYAAGGYVHPLANVPPPNVPAAPRPRMQAPADQRAGGAAPAVSFRNVNVVDPDLVKSYLRGSAGAGDVINIIKENRSTVRQLVSGG